MGYCGKLYEVYLVSYVGIMEKQMETGPARGNVTAAESGSLRKLGVAPRNRLNFASVKAARWVVVKPFWVPIIIRHLIFRVPKKGP